MDFSKKINRIAVKLKPAAEKMVLRKHPWIFEGSIVKITENANSGDLAVIYSQKTNKLIGLGLIDLESPIRIKIISFGPANFDKSWFINTVEEAYRLRSSLIESSTNSFRCIFGEADSMPGVICDVYNTNVVLKLYSAAWIPYLEELKKALVLVLNPKSIVLRLSRNLQKLKLQHENGSVIAGELENNEVIFTEHGVKFSANLIHGHKTGFFLDHRNNRKTVGGMASGKSVLDVFCYAGGFSVHALAGGALKVTCVDISKPALELAKKNAKLNKFSGQLMSKEGDAFKVLEEFVANGNTFDIVVIDPPSFAKQKSEVESAQKHYYKLAKLGGLLTKPRGYLILASCSSRIVPEVFKMICLEALEDSNFDFYHEAGHDIDHPTISSFPEGRYLKCLYFKKKA